MTENDLPKAYEAKKIDAKWYDFWEKNNLFKADSKLKKKPYCIVMPPPNVTGVLHMGHALTSTLQDILIRWKRMSGFESLWIPGTDHAGIATQTVVERNLIKSTGKKRKDFARDEFLKHVWDWKEKSQHHILGQLKKLGCSCDWSRLRFTMDESNNRAVRVMFKKLYDQKLIYRGDYLVNWDPVTQTALADDEVEYEERQSFLWHFKYPLADKSGFIHIATTRPETMLGDTAIAISPKDLRYTHLAGKKVILPLMNREIPIIQDYLVDPEFGTGMVKVTPAHDPNDYQMGLTHQLPRINIMTPDGKINENGGKFARLTMEEARKAVVDEMKALGFLEKVEPHVNRVGVSYRSKAVIEPYMSLQWFINMEPFKEKLRRAVSEEKLKLIPKNFENTYFHWIDNLHDWCISRQLWWGHRIPVWYCKEDPSKMLCYDGEGEPEEVKQNRDLWVQDEDVLDTWFSSALWPFSTLGWPDNTEDLKTFYPNSVLVTGHDILFFWVARMMMMGEYALGKLPFPETFLNGLIYGKSYWKESKEGGIHYISDQERKEFDLGKPLPSSIHFKWEKMSKSKGNIIDPLEVIDEYGTDAIRMALSASASLSREIDLDRRKFEDFKNFANKVWNGARFCLMNLEGDSPLTVEDLSQGLDKTLFQLEDKWILSKLNQTVKSVNDKLNQYQFDQATLEAYDFFWKEFCAFYVEIVKPVLFGKAGNAALRKNKQKLLVIILCQAIRLIHPMAPFITEELFQILKNRFNHFSISNGLDPYTLECLQALQSKACMVAAYPKVIDEKDINLEIEQNFSLIEKVIYAIRNIRGEMKIPPGMTVDVQLIGDLKDSNFAMISNNKDIITSLVKVNLEIQREQNHFHCLGSLALVENIKVCVSLPKELAHQEKNRLFKEKERLENSIQKINSQLGNKEFLENAPKPLVEKQKQLLSQAEKELNEINSKLAVL